MSVHIDGDGWVHCPVCQGKTRIKILDDTVLRNFPLYCPKCHQTSVIDIGAENAKSQSQTHDAEPELG